MRIPLGYQLVSLLLSLALANQAFGAVYRPVHDDSSDESCEDPKPEEQCRLKAADDPSCYLELVPNHGWMRRSCPEGTLFNERDCGCSVSVPQEHQGDSDSSSEEDCDKPAPIPCTRKPTHDRRSYLQFVEGKGWKRQPCPDGTAYSADDCSCTVFLSETHSNDDSSSSSEENIWGKVVAKICNREAEDDRHFYMEMVQGHGWIRRVCAEGTVFDAHTCRCSATDDDSSDSSCEDDDDSVTEEWDGRCLLKAASSQNNFLQFVEGHGWMTRRCPKGTAFNAEDCGCTVIVPSDDSSSSSSEEDSWRYQSYGKSQNGRSGYDDSSSSEEDSNYWGQQTYGKGLSRSYGDSSSEEERSSWNTASYNKGAVPCTRKPTHNKKSYLQFIEGKGWKTQPCPQGTAYSADDCACSVIIANGVNDDSSSSSEEYSHSWNQQSYGKVTGASFGYDDSSSSEEDGHPWSHHGNGIKIPAGYGDGSSEDVNSWNMASYGKKAVPCTRKPTHDKCAYLQFIEGKGWVSQPCPEGTAYSPADCACSVTVAHGDDDDSSSSEEGGHSWSQWSSSKISAYSRSSSKDSWIAASDGKGAVPCTRKPTTDKSSYLQLVEGKGWKKQPCPQGTVYSPKDCACSVTVAHVGSDDSSSSSEEDSHSWGQQTYVKGSIVSAGYGDTSSKSGNTYNNEQIPCTRKPVHDRRSYLQFIEGKGWKRQACPKGTAYNADACLCSITLAHGNDDSSSEEDVQSWSYHAFDKVAVPCTRKPTHDKSSYLQFIEGKGWRTQPCPRGTAYSTVDCACAVTVAHRNADDSSSEEDSRPWSHHGKGTKIPAGYGDSSNGKVRSSWNNVNYRKRTIPCTRKPTHDKSSYLQFIEGKGWTNQPCPEGTAYSAKDCACSVSVAREENDDSSSEEDSNYWGQQTYGKGRSVHRDYGDSSSEEDGSSWNMASYGKKAVPCTRKPTHDKSSYLQFIEGKGWTSQSCPQGTTYSANDCACSITVAHRHNGDSSNGKEDSHSWNQQSYGMVSGVSSSYDDSSSSEEDSHSWSHHGNGIKIPAGYGDGSSSWNTANYHKGAIPCTRKPTHDKSSYLQFIEGMGWISRPCAKGTAYNADDCSCTITIAHGGSDDNDDDSSEEDDHHNSHHGKGTKMPAGYGDISSKGDGSSWKTVSSAKGAVSCMLKPTHDKSSYLQFIEGMGWTSRPCPKGTAYSADDCSCTIIVAYGGSEESSSSEEDGHSWSLQSSSTRSGYGDNSFGEYGNSLNAVSFGGRRVSHFVGDSSRNEDHGKLWHHAAYTNGRASRLATSSGSSYN